MFKFFKRKRNQNYESHDYKSSNYRRKSIICNRAMSIIKNDNTILDITYTTPKYENQVLNLEAYRELKAKFPVICEDCENTITIEDVIDFANEYGCTVDYLIGRTDTPYYTL